MFFRFKRRYKLLQISESYASLEEILLNGDLRFELRYSISQTEAIKREALTVRVTIFTKNIKPLPRLISQRGFIDTRSLVDRLLTWVPDAKIAANAQENQIIVSKVSDISAGINNNVIDQLNAGVAPADIPQMNVSTLKLVPASMLSVNNTVQPVLNFSLFDVSSSPVLPKALMQDMIQNRGIDPSIVTQVTPRSVSSAGSVGGLLQPSNVETHAFDSTSQLTNTYLKAESSVSRTTADVDDEEMIQVLVTEAVDEIELPVSVIIRQNDLIVDGQDVTHFFVKFELLNSSTNVAIDTVTKTLDVSKHVQVFLMPKQPTSVKAGRAETSSQVNLEIKQVDPNATAVKVFKKGIASSSITTDTYMLIGAFPLTNKNQSLLIPVDMPRNSTTIYRVISIGQRGTVGFEYTNVVVRPAHFTPVKALALVAHTIITGVQLEVRSIPPQAIALEFLGRNRTTYENEFVNVGNDIFMISDEVRSLDYVSVVDRDISPNNVYEYVVNVIFDDGRIERSGNALVEFLEQTPDKVDTKITNVIVSHVPDPNVTFDVNTTVVNSTHDVIKALLQKQGIYDLFQDDVEKEREFLKSLIAHNIQRVDLTTGLREDFGVVTTTNFDDGLLRKNQAIQPLVIGHKYRYEITALLRAPETLFNTLVKTRIDETTKKPYSFNPGKFFHPVTLSNGMLVSPGGLKTLFVKDPLMHGAIGSLEVLEVGLDDDSAVIVDASANRFNNELIQINWRIQGAINLYDHFIIMKEVNGARTIVGKTHSEFQYGNCQFYHVITPHDTGEITFIISPVFNDYTPGALVKTNSVVI